MSSSNKVPILMYHSIMDNDEQSVSVQSFKKQMNLMKTMGYQTIKFNELKGNNKKNKSRDPSESAAPYKIYNIGNNDPKKLMEFVKAIESKLEKKAKINLKPLQKGDVYETYADTNKLSSFTKYKSKTSIDKGIGNFVDWFRDYYKC